MPEADIRTERLAQFLRDVRRHKKPYETNIAGLDLLVYPEHVLSPHYCHASKFMAEVVSGIPFENKTVLEVGTGSGLQSLVAARAGARHIVALDINPYAVLNARDNFDRHHVNGEARLSDLFNAVGAGEKFDMIMFEAPYYSFKPASFLEYGVADEGYQTLSKFFRSAGRHLKPNGEMLVGFSAFYGDFAVLQNLITKHRYHVLRHHHDVMGGRSWSVMHLCK